MKNLLLILCVLCSTYCNAQKIHFSDPTNVWNYTYWYNRHPPVPATFYYYTYSYIKDSIIASKTYRSFGFGWIREDFSSQKIYLRDFYNDTEVVIMDYNLKIGDGLSIKYSTEPLRTHYVGEIDSIIINGRWHRVWNFINRWSGGAYSFIEGIGTYTAPLIMAQYLESQDDYEELNCFANKGSYPPLSAPVATFDNVYSCARFPHVGVTNVNIQNSHIYPNPAQNELHIDYPERINQIKIINPLGIQVYTSDKPVENPVIDVSALPSGLYYILVNSIAAYRVEKLGD